MSYSSDQKFRIYYIAEDEYGERKFYFCGNNKWSEDYNSAKVYGKSGVAIAYGRFRKKYFDDYIMSSAYNITSIGYSNATESRI